MGDFHQSGSITTLHNLTRRPLEELEAELLEFSARSPIALVLPCLYSELGGPALANIVAELSEVPYIDELVIGLDRADAEQFAHAQDYFSRLPQRHRIVWIDGPRNRALEAKLQARGLAPTRDGKGRNVWYCFGYVLASARARTVALHDCDIVTYDRSMLARLVYPVACPELGFHFCKGYYARAAGGKPYGRVTRLLVTPLIRSLKRMFGDVEYLDYLDSFRYLLAGEFSLRADVLKGLRIPADWGLEIGVLSEVWWSARGRLCQVEIADVYDHKHQPLTTDDLGAGLSRMCRDIAETLFRRLASQQYALSAETFRRLVTTYRQIALELVEAYHKDALMNGLWLDRHAEQKAIEVFAQSVERAAQQILNDPMDTPYTPSWNHVLRKVPHVLRDLSAAVDADNLGCAEVVDEFPVKLAAYGRSR